MCDFAADAAAAEQLMVGRTLTLERVRQLNAKDYFYQMLKDNPEIVKIYPGIENELLQGAIDCHIHAYPDFVHRSQDMIQIAIEASKCGMRAIAFKDHWNISATSAYLTQRHIDEMIARGELTNRVEVYGGVGMCFGMRPDYVRVGLQYPNFKMIWFPTFTSYGFWRGAGHPEHEGVRLCSEDGKVLPEVKEIMEMAAAKKVGIGFGHTDFQELLPLARLAKEIGPDRCIIGSDFGQVLHMDAIDGMRVFIRALLGFGVKPEEVKVMLKDNPAKLMWLDQREAATVAPAAIAGYRPQRT